MLSLVQICLSVLEKLKNIIHTYIHTHTNKHIQFNLYIYIRFDTIQNLITTRYSVVLKEYSDLHAYLYQTHNTFPGR
jgi:hypothetical protein